MIFFYYYKFCHAQNILSSIPFYIYIYIYRSRSLAPVDKSELKTCIQCTLLSVLHVTVIHITVFLPRVIVDSNPVHIDPSRFITIHPLHAHVPIYIWFNSLDWKHFWNVQCCACVWCFVCLKNSMLYAWMSRGKGNSTITDAY